MGVFLFCCSVLVFCTDVSNITAHRLFNVGPTAQVLLHHFVKLIPCGRKLLSVDNWENKND